MKLLRWIFSAVATVALITIFAKYPLQNKALLADEVTSGAAETVPLAVVDSDAASAETSEGYILREYDGKLAIFKAGNAQPLYVFSVSLETMSDYDKAALQQGIAANNLEELKALVEDYTS